MSNTAKRILTSAAMIAVIGAAAYFGLVQWLATAVAVGMAAELAICAIRAKTKPGPALSIILALYSALFILSAYTAGGMPFGLLFLLVTIAAADTGAWFFGTLIGGDKMWERISAGKTWSGQIAGIICGTLAAMIYSYIFLPGMLTWMGLGVSLLSQYGDLTASAIKRKLNIKDFGKCLPGHGGLMDRFDGWIFVLPIIWLCIATQG